MKKALSLFITDIKKMTPAIIPVTFYCLIAYLLFDTVCPLVLLTGYPCPACGLSRAFFYLCRGQWRPASECNIMLIPWLLLAAYYIIARYFVKIRPIVGELFLCIVCLSTIAYYIYRLICVYPSGPVMVYHEKNLMTLILRSVL